MPIESGASSLPKDTIFCSSFVFENLEGILIEAGHKPVQRIGHGDRNQHHVRVDPDVGARAAARRLRAGLARGVISDRSSSAGRSAHSPKPAHRRRQTAIGIGTGGIASRASLSAWSLAQGARGKIACASQNPGRHPGPVRFLPFPGQSPCHTSIPAPCWSTYTSACRWPAISARSSSPPTTNEFPTRPARFGARVQMTRADHVSGTDRVAEVASAFEDVELVVNIQGDEPLIDPNAIDAAVLPLLEEPAIPMGTLKKRIEDPARNRRPQRRQSGHRPVRKRHLFFARHDSVHARRRPSPLTSTSGFTFIGADFLLTLFRPAGGAARAGGKLEQLRALENGFNIRVVETDYESLRRGYAGRSGARPRK